jgi:hypothetical protein
VISPPVKKVLLCCLLIGTFAAAAGAQSIIWQTPQVITGASDVLTNGAYFGSWAPYDAGANALPVNGVSFQGYSDLPGLTYSFSGGNGGYNGFGSPGTLDANYNGLLQYGQYAIGNGSSTFSWGGMTPGHTYEIQFWVEDARGSTGARWENLSGGDIGATVYGTDTSGPVGYSSPLYSGAASPGYYIVGTFVADSTGSEEILLTPWGGSPDTQINLFQVRDISGGQSPSWNFPHGHLQFKGTNFFLIGLYDYPTETASNAELEKVYNMSNYCQYVNTVEFFDHNSGWNNGFITYLNPSILQTANNWGLGVVDDMWTDSGATNASSNGNWLIEPAELAVGSDWYNEMQLLNPYSGVNTNGPLGWTNNGALLMYGQVDESTGSPGAAQYPTLNQFLADYIFYHNYASVPVWYNCNPAQPSGWTVNQVAPWASGCDCFSMDVYAGEPANNLYIRQNMDFMRAVTGTNKPVLMVLEAVGYFSDIYTYADKANQVYGAIIHGANGIWWYGAAGQASGAGLDPNSTQWQDVIKISRQLKTMQEALANCDGSVCRFYNTQTSQQITSGISASGDNNQIEMLKASDSTKDYLICLNTTTNNQTVTINGVSGWRGGPRLFNFTGGTDTTMGTVITFAPEQVIIYASTNTAASGPLANGTYAVINVNSGQALNVDGGSQTVGYNLDQVPYTGAPWQQWVFTSIGGNEYTIVNANSWQACDVNGRSLGPGGIIHQWTPVGAANQTWKVIPNGDGSWRIESKESTLLMEVAGASVTNGAGIDQWNMTGPGATAPAPNQKWVVLPAGASEVNVDVFVPAGSGPNPESAFSGPGVLGGGCWNELGNGQSIQTSTSSLLDANGAATTVGINLTGVSASYGDFGGSDPASSAAAQGLLGDYLAVNNGTITVQVTGLFANTSYNLVVYSCGNQTNENAVITGAINYRMGPCSRGTFQAGANFAQNTNAVTDSSGRLTVSLSSTGYACFNGLQVFGDIPGAQGIPVSLTARAGSNNTVVLSWPSAATGYALQTRANLSGAWNDSGLIPMLQGNQCVVTNTVSGQMKFFRLVHLAD